MCPTLFLHQSLAQDVDNSKEVLVTANFLAFNLNELEEKAGSLWWLGGKWGGCT